MKTDFLTVAALLSSASVSALPQDAALAALLKRATDQAPDGYAPASVDCPSTRPSIRQAGSGLSPQEKQWLKKRRSHVEQPMRDFLGRMNIDGIDTDSYLDKLAGSKNGLPTIAIAASGGGYRAMLNGGGAMAAFDDRVDGTTRDGHLGGLLQAATYTAGLSGGGWLMGSIFVNNFTTIQDLLESTTKQDGNLWQLQNSILDGPDSGSISLFDTASYYEDLQNAVDAKSNANFDVSLTDYWGRGLAFQLVKADQGGLGFTWSSIADDEAFSTGAAPMPILVADGRNPGQHIISLNATNYEFTPWELGSWDPTVFGFAPLKYLGSKFSNGELPSSEDCIAGFDNAGYVMGTSSSLFNQFILNLDQAGSSVPDFVLQGIEDVLKSLSQSENDIADYNPNPFSGFRSGNNVVADLDSLTLVDGGEDLQNIPLQPLIQPERAVDVVFAVDSSADTGNSWPNGTSLVATYERSLNRSISGGSHFPSIPDVNTFVNLGLNNRPTFFGCDSQNITGDTPLVVYLPNAPYQFLSNTSTFKMTYSHDERYAMVTNGYDAVTRANNTMDKEWGTCIGCAVLHRSMERDGTDMPSACQKCFSKYCWDGTTNSTTPPPYQPEPFDELIEVDSGVAGLAGSRSVIALVGAFAVSTLMLV